MGVIAKSEWRGGEQKKLEKLEFDMPRTRSTTYNKKKKCIVEVVVVNVGTIIQCGDYSVETR